MAEFAYSSLVSAIETILRADTRLRGVHVTQEMDFPIEFPWVQIRLVRSERRAYQMVAGVPGGAPDDVTITVELVAWQMSAQGAADAARQRDVLVSALVDVLRDNYRLGGSINTHQVTDISFAQGIRDSDQNAEHAGIYANATLSLACRVLT